MAAKLFMPNTKKWDRENLDEFQLKFFLVVIAVAIAAVFNGSSEISELIEVAVNRSTGNI